MAESLKDFLTKYYKQLHFNSMNADVRARFDGWVKKGSLTDTMQDWRDSLMHLDNGKYVQNELPDTTKESVLSDSAARELFVLFQNAFVGMNSDLAKLKKKDSATGAFVEEYFGSSPDDLFYISPATTECDEGIQAIISLLQENRDVRDWLSEQQYGDTKLFENPNALTDFLKSCSAPKKEYNTKGKIQTKIKQVAHVLRRKIWDDPEGVLAPIISLATPVRAVLDDNAFAMDPKDVDPNKLIAFRKNIQKRTGILQTLYRSTTIRDNFAIYDNGPIKITKIISDDAEGKVNYQDTKSPNYVSPKAQDSSTPLKQMQKWVSNTYGDTLKKYEELRGAPLFFFTESEDIFKAIDSVKLSDGKVGIKPTDGLGALLKNAEGIKKKLKNEPKAAEYFDWFTETMTEVQNKVPDAVEGAWKDGNQMRCVITQIILQAAESKDPRAVQKAKVAMEIMNAMKYGMATSKIMDAMNSTDFTIFSDGKLSWNNNEGIRFVTGALDKSIKFAFKTVGYGITIARNQIMMSKSRSSFKNADNQQGPLASAFQAQKETLKSEKDVQKSHLRGEIKQLRTDKRDRKQTLADLDANGINSHTIKTKENEVAAHKATLNANQTAEDEYQQDTAALTEMEPEIRALMAEINSLKTEINSTLPLQIKKAEMLYRNPASYNDMPELVKQEREKELYINWKNMQNELVQKQDLLTTKRSELAQKMGNYAQIRRRKDSNEAAHTLYETTKQTHDDLKAKTDAFRTATKELKDINKTLRKANTAMKNWDQDHVNMVFELEKFWNQLQGNDNVTFSLFTHRAQEDFTKNKRDVLLQQMMSQTRLAA